MGWSIDIRQFTIRVPQDHIRARDLSSLFGATNALYEMLGALVVFGPKPFVNGQLKKLRDNESLRITRIHYGSDGNASLLGIDSVLEQLRKIFTEIRFWKEQKTQEEEKTKQSQEKTAQDRETTRRMRLENVRHAMETFQEYKNMSPEDQAEFMRLMQGSITDIDENPNKLE